jgi:hypothetical protein
MFHPLIDDLTKLKDQELENKISELTKKYFTATRLGQGLAANQIVMILDSIKMEQERRRVEAAQKAQNSPKRDGFDDLIKIG